MTQSVIITRNPLVGLAENYINKISGCWHLQYDTQRNAFDHDTVTTEAIKEHTYLRV